MNNHSEQLKLSEQQDHFSVENLKNIPKEEIASRIEECLRKSGVLQETIDNSFRSEADHSINYTITIGLDNKDEQPMVLSETDTFNLSNSINEEVNKRLRDLPEGNYSLTRLYWEYEIPSKENPNEHVILHGQDVLHKLS